MTKKRKWGDRTENLSSPVGCLTQGDPRAQVSDTKKTQARSGSCKRDRGPPIRECERTHTGKETHTGLGGGKKGMGRVVLAAVKLRTSGISLREGKLPDKMRGTDLNGFLLRSEGRETMH